MVFAVLRLRRALDPEPPVRRAASLLDDLALEDGRWIVPSYFVDRARELVEVTRDHLLEGVVLKRLDAPYLAGRRSAAWVKHKHRRQEQVLVLGRRPADGSRPAPFFLGREDREGRVRYAGEAAFGLSADHPERIAGVVGRTAARRGNPCASSSPLAAQAFGPAAATVSGVYGVMMLLLGAAAAHALGRRSARSVRSPPR